MLGNPSMEPLPVFVGIPTEGKKTVAPPKAQRLARPFSKSGKNTASTPINGKYAHSEYT